MLVEREVMGRNAAVKWEVMDDKLPVIVSKWEVMDGKVLHLVLISYSCGNDCWLSC